MLMGQSAVADAGHHLPDTHTAGLCRRLLLGLLVLILAACSPAPDSSPAAAVNLAKGGSASTVAQTAAEELVLNFSNWSDYMPEGMLKDFERETGIKVNYRNYGSSEDLQKLVSLKSDSDDLVVPSLSYGKTQLARGYYQPLKKTLLPNLKNLSPTLVKNMERSDPGNRHFVPWAWGYTTLFVNKTRVAKSLGDLAYPDNEFDLVFNPTYTARLKSCGIAYVDSPSEIVPLAMHHLGLNPYAEDITAYAQAIEMLKGVRKDIAVFSDKMIDVLAQDKTCVGIAWSGDIQGAIAALKEAGNRDTLLGVLPSAGTLMFVDALAIPVNAKHPRNAHAFIDFYLRAKNAARMPNEIGYPNGNEASLAFVQDDIKNNPAVFPPPEFFSKLVPSDGHSDKIRWTMMQGYVSFAFRLETGK
jgi:putrescine transport system substrate-binding protein